MGCMGIGRGMGVGGRWAPGTTSENLEDLSLYAPHQSEQSWKEVCRLTVRNRSLESDLIGASI